MVYPAQGIGLHFDAGTAISAQDIIFIQDLKKQQEGISLYQL